MYKESQRGFAVAAVVGIVAILALLGGGAYIATKYDANVDTDVSTTTDSMQLDGGITVTKDNDAMMKDKSTTTMMMDASTTVDANLGTDVSTDVNAGANVNVNLGY